MKNNIVVILDRSGSMGTIKDDAIGGFNTFVEEQKKLGGNASLTLVQFDDKYDLVYDDIPLDEVPLLDNNTFVPRGMTALYDAIGKTINKISNRITNPCPACNKYGSTENVVVAILTDGMENYSREFNQHNINEMISHQRDHHNWNFIFLAANQDAFATGTKIGIRINDTFSWCATGMGTRSAYQDMSKSVACYRTDIDPQSNKK